MQHALKNQNTLVETAEITTERGTTWKLSYYLQTYESSDGTKAFGIKVDKLSANDEIVEQAETFAITKDFYKARAITAYLAKGTVPPCVLLEMVDEWFSSEDETRDYVETMEFSE